MVEAPVPAAEIVIGQDGSIAFLWSDELVGLTELGQPEIFRASHVEPRRDGKWYAFLNPIGGPVFGPFDRRGEALAAEQAWVSEWLGRGGHEERP